MSEPRTSPSIFARGAVDLSALRTPPGRAPAGGAGSPTSGGPGGNGARGSGGAGDAGPSAGPDQSPASAAASASRAGVGVSIIDVTEATFQTEVLERSLSTPVVVDFWADWCEPCKQLSPVLEKLAVEAGGAWVLAKVDVDANQRLAQMFRIQSIPTVYAVVQGQPIDAFPGVIPESQLRPWLDAVCKAGGVAIEAPPDPRFEEADEALINGDLDRAEQAYRKILNESPAESGAEAGLAQVGLLRRVEGVQPGAVLAAVASAPDDVDAGMRAADVEVLAGQAEAAYRRLVELVRRTAAADRERVRQHLLSLFLVAGPDDPAVAAARRALANALF